MDLRFHRFEAVAGPVDFAALMLAAGARAASTPTAMAQARLGRAGAPTPFGAPHGSFQPALAAAFTRWKAG